MSFLQLDQISWRQREKPLSPTGLFVTSAQLPALIERLTDGCNQETLPYRAAHSQKGLVLLGEEEQLPWVPGVTYLGVDREAPHLLIPTNVSPDFPLELINRAVKAHVSAPPVAMIPHESLLFPMAEARPIDVAKFIALGQTL